jgi:hypothetical protein
MTENSDYSGHDKWIAANYSGTYVESTEKKQLDLGIRVFYTKEKYLWCFTRSNIADLYESYPGNNLASYVFSDHLTTLIKTLQGTFGLARTEMCCLAPVLDLAICLLWLWMLVLLEVDVG